MEAQIEVVHWIKLGELCIKGKTACGLKIEAGMRYCSEGSLPMVNCKHCKEKYLERLLLKGTVRGKKKETLLTKASKELLDNDFYPPYRIGKKQKRAVLDCKGHEVIVFPKGLENTAKEFVVFLNEKFKV